MQPSKRIRSVSNMYRKCCARTTRVFHDHLSVLHIIIASSAHMLRASSGLAISANAELPEALRATPDDIALLLSSGIFCCQRYSLMPVGTSLCCRLPSGRKKLRSRCDLASICPTTPPPLPLPLPPPPTHTQVHTHQSLFFSLSRRFVTTQC
jgi:hypothetical protein